MLVVWGQAMLARLRELDLSLVHNLEDNDVAVSAPFTPLTSKSSRVHTPVEPLWRG